VIAILKFWCSSIKERMYFSPLYEISEKVVFPSVMMFLKESYPVIETEPRIPGGSM